MDRGKPVGEPSPARRDDDQIVTFSQPVEVRGADLADLHVPTALLEVLEQLRQVEAIVDGQARRGEVARELERLFASDVVPVAAVRRAVAVPVVDAELPLSRARVVVMGDGAR